MNRCQVGGTPTRHPILLTARRGRASNTRPSCVVGERREDRREVVQWKDVGLWNPLQTFDSSPPGHWPLAQPAARRALNAEVPGSKPGRPAILPRSFNGQDRTPRTFRSQFDSAVGYQNFRPSFRGQDTALRTLKPPFESARVDHILRACLSVAGRTAVYRVTGVRFSSRPPVITTL